MPRTKVGALGPLALVVVACGAEELTSPALEVAPMAANTFLTIDQSGNVGQYTSLAAGSGLHLTYYDDTDANLKYATCAQSCTLAGSWSRGVIDQAGMVGAGSSLRLASNGRRYVAYLDFTNHDLKFATCAPTAACMAPADWSKGRIDTEGFTGTGVSLALGNDGSKQVSYLSSDGDRVIRYATCLSSCTAIANWSRVTIDRLPTTISVTANARRWGSAPMVGGMSPTSTPERET